MSGSECCAGCRFWHDVSDTGAIGVCRRRPPTVHVVQIQRPLAGGAEARPMATFPPSPADSWCGEFEEDE